jgi:hypothetical protein
MHVKFPPPVFIGDWTLQFSALWSCSNEILGEGVNIGFAYEGKTIESLSPKFGVV